MLFLLGRCRGVLAVAIITGRVTVLSQLGACVGILVSSPSLLSGCGVHYTRGGVSLVTFMQACPSTYMHTVVARYIQVLTVSCMRTCW